MPFKPAKLMTCLQPTASASHQGFLDGLGLSLNENHIVNHIIYMDDKLKWRKLLEKRIEELSKSVHFGTQNKVLLSKLKK